MGQVATSDGYPDNYSHTGCVCVCCGGREPLTFTEEVFFLQIVQLQLCNGELVGHPLIDEEDQDFLFEPVFFHFSCWEELDGSLHDHIEDQPPNLDARSAFKCRVCGSGVREWERAGIVTVGELHTSKRSPNGRTTTNFQPSGKPDIYCLYCLATLNETIQEMWPTLYQYGECIDCQYFRCWRDEEKGCGCGCHE